MNFRLRVCLKPSNDRGEFELDLARCNKNIAENLFALGHETDPTNLVWHVIHVECVCFSSMSCKCGWMDRESLQDMSRILKVILYQTAESLGHSQWELRRIANQVMLRYRGSVSSCLLRSKFLKQVQ